MDVSRHAWFSPHTGVSMPVIRYGRRGYPLVYVPTSGGDHAEFERYGLPDDCSEWIEAGLIQIVSIDGRGPDTLFNTKIPPAERISSYARAEHYVADEVLPWVVQETGHERFGVVGASYGAFVAANLLFKRHERVEIACGLGGVYQMWHRLDGYHDDAVYFHTPLEYLPRLEDEAILTNIRRTRGIVMFAAEDDPWLQTTHQLAEILKRKRLPHVTETWASPADHHERWWKQQIRVFIERYLQPG